MAQGTEGILTAAVVVCDDGQLQTNDQHRSSRKEASWSAVPQPCESPEPIAATDLVLKW